MPKELPPIDSKTARDKLEPRHNPYWHRLSAGLYVGYHCSLRGGDGNWHGRWRNEDGRQLKFKVDNSRFKADKPGRNTKYEQAVVLVHEWHARIKGGATHKSLTVADAIEVYLKSKEKGANKSGVQLDTERVLRNLKKNRSAFEATVFNHPLAKVPLDRLRSHHMSSWLIGRAEPKDADNPESIRAAMNTANRDWARVRAALRYAYKQQLLTSPAAIDGVEPFRNVASPRTYLPSADDIARLFAVAPSEVTRIAKFLALTGCRPGEVFKLTQRSFNKQAGTLDIDADTKTGRRTLPLSSAATEFVASIAADKIGAALLFPKANGKAWDGNEYAKAFRDARSSAGLTDEFVAYSFRHLWITEHCKTMSIAQVAKIAGTSIKMIDEYYFALQSDDARQQLDIVAELIRQQGL